MENKTVSIKKNYLYNTVYQILTIITPFITAPYISRVLGSSGVGIYSYTNSIAVYFTIFASLGTASYGQREIAMHRDDQEKSSILFWEIELLSIVTTAVVTVAWVFFIIVSSEYTVYYEILTISIIAVVFDISWFFSGLELFKYIVIRNTVVKLAGIALLFIFVNTKNDIGIYIAIISLTGILGNISMWTYLPRLLKKVKFRTLRPFRHLKQTIAYFIPTIAASIYTVLDKTMIGVITKSSDQNGYYEQATKIIRMIESLLFSLNTVMSSRQSYLFAEKKYDEMRDKINKSYDYLFGIAIAAMFGLQGIAANFVPWFFGDGYEPVIKLLYVMAPLPLIICISNVLGCQYLTPSGQRVRSSKGIVTGAIVNFILNLLLIPFYASIGATIASLAAETIISIIYMHMSKGFTSWTYLVKISWKKFIAGIIMLIAVLLIGDGYSGSILITVIQIITGGIIYSIVLIIFRDSAIDYIINMMKEKFHGRFGA